MPSVNTPLGKIELFEQEQYIRHTYAAKQHNSVKEMSDHIQACGILIPKGKKIANLIDIRQLKGATKEVRDYTSNHPTIIEHSLCAAVLVGSGITKILGNIFIRYNKPRFPTRLFTDEQKALEWLSLQTTQTSIPL